MTSCLTTSCLATTIGADIGPRCPLLVGLSRGDRDNPLLPGAFLSCDWLRIEVSMPGPKPLLCGGGLPRNGLPCCGAPLGLLGAIPCGGGPAGACINDARGSFEPIPRPCRGCEPGPGLPPFIFISIPSTPGGPFGRLPYIFCCPITLERAGGAPLSLFISGGPSIGPREPMSLLSASLCLRPATCSPAGVC